jgi:hypothetical protein
VLFKYLPPSYLLHQLHLPAPSQTEHLPDPLQVEQVSPKYFPVPLHEEHLPSPLHQEHSPLPPQEIQDGSGPFPPVVAGVISFVGDFSGVFSFSFFEGFLFFSFNLDAVSAISGDFSLSFMRVFFR